MIFETHAHYDDEAFDSDRKELIGQLQQAGISPIINIASGLSSCKSTLELVECYPFFYGAIGVHPSETGELDEENFLRLKSWCMHERVVALGEIGLDYHYADTDKVCQRRWFARQLQLAREVGLPVVIHSRDAASDTMELMREHHAERIGGVIHCYSYSVEYARLFLDMGFYIGIGGVITFKNARKLRQVVEMLPMERILLETDSPYLAPVPYRGRRNCSLYLPLVAEEIARIKGVAVEEVIRVTDGNARRLFRIPDKGK